MIRIAFLIGLTVCGSTIARATLPVPATSLQRHGNKASPFDGLRWEGDTPRVLVGETWYVPLEIDSADVDDVLAFCETTWPGQMKKRFGEDLVEALLKMGHDPGPTVDLRLEPAGGGDEVTLEGVSMTREKRQRIRDGSSGRSREERAPAGPAVVSRAEARKDLEEFQERLEDQFAYLELSGIDLDGELRDLEKELPAQVDVTDLAEELNELLMRFGDGHASVSAPDGRRPTSYLPFLMDSAAGGVVAFQSNRSALMDPDRPFVRSIDGRPLEDWLEAVRPGIVAGSLQLVRHRSLRALRDINPARMHLGLEWNAPVRLELSDAPSQEPGTDGGNVKVHFLALAGRRPLYGDWPQTRSRLIEGSEDSGATNGIGYLRLPEMDDDLVGELRRWMSTFKGADALIVDVRGNGGGRRGLLLALAGYLVDEPVVGNVAAYRTSKRFDRDHLGGSRYMYRAGDDHWTKAQSKAIARFAATFEPEWSLPEGFSEWHYLVLDKTGGARRVPFRRAGRRSLGSRLLQRDGHLPRRTRGARERHSPRSSERWRECSFPRIRTAAYGNQGPLCFDGVVSAQRAALRRPRGRSRRRSRAGPARPRAGWR